jgi:hypothetical protein
MRVYATLTALCLIATIILSCGGGGGVPYLTSAHRSAAEFTIDVLPDAEFNEAARAQWELVAHPRGDETLVNVRVQGAQGLRALFCEVHYDAVRYCPVGVCPTSALGPPEQLLQLAILDEPGTVHYAQMLTRPQQRTGFSGSGTLVRLRFAHHAAWSARRTSAPPVDEAARTRLRDRHPATLCWYYTNPGDYNQDGLVNINDIAPLGKLYGDSNTLGYFLCGSAQRQADGNDDGLISINDLTAIGRNWGNSALGGYRVYESTELTDYPFNGLGGNGGGAVRAATLALADSVTEDTAVSRLEFRLSPASADIHKYYWVRPVDDDGVEGIASEPLTQIGLEAPRDDRSAALAEWDAGTATLTWGYYSTGDFNQDGGVNIADLMSVGVHMGHAVPPDPNAIEAVIDSDGNGVIEMVDSRAVDDHWLTEVTGYNVYASTSLIDYPQRNDEPPALEPIGSVSLWSATGEGFYERLHFEFTVADPLPGMYYWVRPTDTEGYAGTPSNHVGGI